MVFWYSQSWAIKWCYKPYIKGENKCSYSLNLKRPWFQQAFNNKVAVARCLEQYWQIFSLFLIICYYFDRLKAREVSWKILESREVYPILHSAPCSNKYIYIQYYIYNNTIVTPTVEIERHVTSIIYPISHIWMIYFANSNSFWLVGLIQEKFLCNSDWVKQSAHKVKYSNV